MIKIILIKILTINIFFNINYRFFLLIFIYSVKNVYFKYKFRAFGPRLFIYLFKF